MAEAGPDGGAASADETLLLAGVRTPASPPGDRDSGGAAATRLSQASQLSSHGWSSDTSADALLLRDLAASTLLQRWASERATQGGSGSPPGAVDSRLSDADRLSVSTDRHSMASTPKRSSDTRRSTHRLSCDSLDLAAGLRAARLSAGSEAPDDAAHAVLRGLAPFVPRALLEEIAVAASLAAFMQHSDPVAAVLEPRATVAAGAVLVADISGFTALTERLSLRGAAGVELLTRCINLYFTAVTDVIFAHGGDVLKFVGDAMIVAFLVSDEAAEPREALRRVTLCAARCACALAAELGHVLMLPDGSIEALPPSLSQRPEAPPSPRTVPSRAGSSEEAMRRKSQPRRSRDGSSSHPGSFREGREDGTVAPSASAFLASAAAVVQSTERGGSGAPSDLRGVAASRTASENSNPGDGNVVAEGAMLSLKLSLAAGPLRLLMVGGAVAHGFAPRWEYFACDPIGAAPCVDGAEPPVFTSQIASADATGLKGMAVASAAVAALLGADAICDDEIGPLPHGARVLRAVVPPPAAVPPALPPLSPDVAAGRQLPHGLASLPADGGAARAALPLLRAFFLDAVRERIEAGQYEWLNELRTLSVLFVGVPGLTAPRADGAPPLLDECAPAQAAVAAVAAAVAAEGGAFLQARCDDKGFVMLAAFGLPGSTHEDGSTRAVRAALASRDALAAAGLAGRAGVTTGRLLCACVGAPGRAEYTAFGDAINLAARLMCAANVDDAARCVLVDEGTAGAACGAAAFAPLPPLRLKGRSAPVPASAATPTGAKTSVAPFVAPLAGPRAPLALHATAPADCKKPFVGRISELETLLDALHATLAGNGSAGAGGIVIVEGEAGIGKSALLRAALDRAAPEGGVICASRGDATARKPLALWRGIITDLLMHTSALASDTADADVAWRGVLADALDFDPAELPQLLQQLLPGSFAAGGTDNENGGSVRDRVAKALTALVRSTQATRPVVIVLEDLHACDTASLHLAYTLARACPAALLLITARPMWSGRERSSFDGSGGGGGERDAEAALMRLRNAPRALTLNLGPLRLEDTAALLAAGLAGGPVLPPRIVAAVHDRTRGHPLYVDQMLTLLRQRADVLAVATSPGSTRDDGALERLLLGLDDFLRSALSVHAVVTQRIDSLPAASALTLKVAAVTGRTSANLQLLRAIHPLRPSPRQLAIELQLLRRLDFLATADAGNAEAAPFASVIVRDVAYELIPTRQRRQLHIAAADELRRPEGVCADGCAAAAAVAWHLSHAAGGVEPAEDPQGSYALITAWVGAADSAAARGVPEEAARCFAAAAELADALAAARLGQDHMRVELRVRGAEALASAGQLLGAADTAAAALRSLGVPQPRAAPGLLARLCACGAGAEVAAARRALREGGPAASALALRAADVLGRVAVALPNAAGAAVRAAHAKQTRRAAR